MTSLGCSAVWQHRPAFYSSTQSRLDYVEIIINGSCPKTIMIIFVWDLASQIAVSWSSFTKQDSLLVALPELTAELVQQCNKLSSGRACAASKPVFLEFNLVQVQNCQTGCRVETPGPGSN